MRRLLQGACVALVLCLVVVFSQTGRTADTPAEKAALKLFNSLTDEQKKAALLPFNAPERYKEQFPAVKRKGLPLSDLKKEQIALLNEAIKAMTSEYGSERLMQLAKQTPAKRRYLTFYGDPGKGKFAWRLAQHHLTLVYVEFGKKTPDEFGPILLGGNPVRDMWDQEDQLFLKLYASLSKEELKQAKIMNRKTKGLQVGKMNEKARELAHALLKKRTEVFAPFYRKNFEIQLKKEGGIDKLYFGVRAKDATKSHHKGGRYYWQYAGERVLCNWQTQGNQHIHTTLKARPAKKS